MTLEQMAADLGRGLAARYGGAVTVEYVDVYSAQMAQHPQVLRLLVGGGTPLPIVSLNGEPAFAGGISPSMIEEELLKLGVSPSAT